MRWVRLRTTDKNGTVRIVSPPLHASDAHLRAAIDAIAATKKRLGEVAWRISTEEWDPTIHRWMPRTAPARHVYGPVLSSYDRHQFEARYGAPA